MCISACHLMGLLKYDKSSLFHSIRLYVSYLYLQIQHDKTPNSTTTRQLDWLTTVAAVRGRGCKTIEAAVSQRCRGLQRCTIAVWTQ